MTDLHIGLQKSVLVLSAMIFLSLPIHAFAGGGGGTPAIPIIQPILDSTMEVMPGFNFFNFIMNPIEDEAEDNKELTATKAQNAAKTASATFVSSDNSNVAFTVNLDKSSYTDKENITFSFDIEDVDTGEKPVDSSVQVKVGSGSYTEIISESDVEKSYNISLPPIFSGGQSTLTFKAPDLCGSAFSFSVFGSSLFGKKDCEFEKTIEITTNTPPTLPQLQGSCTVGSNNQYGFSSTDSDDVYYEIDFNRDGVDTRIPSSGFMSSSPAVGTTSYSGWNTQGLKLLSARATDSYGETNGWKNYSLTCTPSCSAPVVCDGGNASLDFFAQPQLVLPGNSTVLHWSLKNVLACSISSNKRSAWYGFVDSWGWDVVGSQTQKETTSGLGEVTYTLSCTDFDGANVSATTKIRLVPNWQEF